MNNREVGAVFFKIYQNILRKYNLGNYYDGKFNDEMERDFFLQIKNKFPNVNLIIHQLNKDLVSQELKIFISGFYVEKVLDNHYECMSKLKNLHIKDLKSFQVDLSENFLRMKY